MKLREILKKIAYRVVFDDDVDQAEQEILGLLLGEEEIEGEIICEYNEWLSTTDEISVAFKKAAQALYKAQRDKIGGV